MLPYQPSPFSSLLASTRVRLLFLFTHSSPAISAQVRDLRHSADCGKGFAGRQGLRVARGNALHRLHWDPGARLHHPPAQTWGKIPPWAQGQLHVALFPPLSCWLGPPTHSDSDSGVEENIDEKLGGGGMLPFALDYFLVKILYYLCTQRR